MSRQTRNYEEDAVVYQLNRKADINITGKQIAELKRFPGEGGQQAKGDIGIKAKGKIDFLVNYCHYSHFYVSKF